MLTHSVTILIVEDDYLIRLGYRDALQAAGYAVVATARTGEQALELAERHRPSHVIMDIRLKGSMDGFAVAVELQRVHPCRIIFATGCSDSKTLRRLATVPSMGVLIKPIIGSAFSRIIGDVTAVH